MYEKIGVYIGFMFNNHIFQFIVEQFNTYSEQELFLMIKTMLDTVIKVNACNNDFSDIEKNIVYLQNIFKENKKTYPHIQSQLNIKPKPQTRFTYDSQDHMLLKEIKEYISKYNNYYMYIQTISEKCLLGACSIFL